MAIFEFLSQIAQFVPVWALSLVCRGWDVDLAWRLSMKALLGPVITEAAWEGGEPFPHHSRQRPTPVPGFRLTYVVFLRSSESPPSHYGQSRTVECPAVGDGPRGIHREESGRPAMFCFVSWLENKAQQTKFQPFDSLAVCQVRRRHYTSGRSQPGDVHLLQLLWPPGHVGVLHQ
jgi:hypothetical protein